MNTKNKKQNNNKKNGSNLLIPAIAVFIVIIGFVYYANKGKLEAAGDGAAGSENYTIAADGADIVIPIDEVTETAAFYPAEVDGVKMEVLAVKATDGTVRTAFNTCQVCYSSGRGYYKQSGDVLVCQNCGNQFKVDEVEITRGGCNPVPIFSENKTVEEETITISNEFLQEAKVIFSNWKSE